MEATEVRAGGEPPREPPPPPDGSDGKSCGPGAHDCAAPPAPSLPPWRTLFTEQEVAAATRVFRTIADNPDLKKLAQASSELAALFSVAREVVHPTRNQLQARRKDVKHKKKASDRAALEMSGIRQMRKVKAVGYSGGSVDIPLPPWVADNAEIDAFIDSQSVAEAAAVRNAGAVLPPTTHMLSGAESSDPLPPAAAPLTSAEAAETTPSTSPATTKHRALTPLNRKLNSKRKCHICFKHIEYLHHFYDQLCTPGCAEFNYTKRFSEANMCGRVCLVTGARVKIGYCITLKLLRMGAAHVIATTRFPHDAARRYAQEPDFVSFRGRLSIYGLDFRDISLLHHFTVHVKAMYGRLDVLINNAAQTVRRPSSYYAHLLENEAEAVPRAILDVADVVDVHRASGGGFRFHHGNPGVLAAIRTGSDTAETAADETSPLVPLVTEIVPSGTINVSAANSQLALLDHDDGQRGHAHFPLGLYDRDDQQVDLREHNSWTQRAGEISTVEMMEVHAINTFAPWVLVSEFRSLMAASKRPSWIDGENDAWDKYIVNVSAKEGQFYRTKTVFHPHTNMAKAALNMLTRTSASDFAQDGIYMTAVDTGWITDEAPLDLHERRADAPPPLDEWDGAMRVLDPVLSGIAGEEKLWGVFLKNYLPSRW